MNNSLLETTLWNRYLRILQYLLRLKRTQMELEKCWASAMHQDHSEFAKRRNDVLNSSPSKQRRQRFKPMWRVREHMAFLIRNLQFYIQVTDPEHVCSTIQTIYWKNTSWIPANERNWSQVHTPFGYNIQNSWHSILNTIWNLCSWILVIITDNMLLLIYSTPNY